PGNQGQPQGAEAQQPRDAHLPVLVHRLLLFLLGFETFFQVGLFVFLQGIEDSLRLLLGETPLAGALSLAFLLILFVFLLVGARGVRLRLVFLLLVLVVFLILVRRLLLLLLLLHTQERQLQVALGVHVLGRELEGSLVGIHRFLVLLLIEKSVPQIVDSPGIQGLVGGRQGPAVLFPGLLHFSLAEEDIPQIVMELRRIGRRKLGLGVTLQRFGILLLLVQLVPLPVLGAGGSPGFR